MVIKVFTGNTPSARGIIFLLLLLNSLASVAPTSDEFGCTDCCTGDQACDLVVTTLFSADNGSCNGLKACLESSAIIADNSCTSDACISCCLETFGTVGTNSCNDYHACLKSLSEIGSNACNGQNSCSQSSGIIGNDSCLEFAACNKLSSANVGPGSCIGQSACRYVDSVSIGSNSCIGATACGSKANGAGERSAELILVDIGSNSCIGDGACQCNYPKGSNVPVLDNECNIDLDDDQTCCLPTTGADCVGLGSDKYKWNIEHGQCFYFSTDWDNDGVPDHQDACLASAEGVQVDAAGCESDSCSGLHACLGSSADIGSNSCNDGDFACKETSGIIADNSCNGFVACHKAAATTSINSCNGMAACAFADSVHIGSNSCIGENACGSNIDIDGRLLVDVGDNSCIGDEACSCNYPKGSDTPVLGNECHVDADGDKTCCLPTTEVACISPGNAKYAWNHEVQQCFHVTTDWDNDGVPDFIDFCLGTQEGIYVDELGCELLPSVGVGSCKFEWFRSCVGSSAIIGSDSCNDDYLSGGFDACKGSSGIIGNNSCNGGGACQNSAAKVGLDSCNGGNACAYLGSVYVGNSSCVGRNSCGDESDVDGRVLVDVGSNACNGDHACNCNFPKGTDLPVLDNECNYEGNWITCCLPTTEDWCFVITGGDVFKWNHIEARCFHANTDWDNDGVPDYQDACLGSTESAQVDHSGCEPS